MPRGQYERRHKTVRLVQELRDLADEIEKELAKVDKAEALIKALQIVED